MRIDGIDLSPEAAGTLAALVDGRMSTVTQRKFRFGPAGDQHYFELVQAGFVAEFPITAHISRYELLREVQLPEIEFSGCRAAQIYSVILTSEQREQLAMERQNDNEISHAIAGGTYEQSRFDRRCLGNYE